MYYSYLLLLDYLDSDNIVELNQTSRDLKKYLPDIKNYYNFSRYFYLCRKNIRKEPNIFLPLAVICNRYDLLDYALSNNLDMKEAIFTAAYNGKKEILEYIMDKYLSLNRFLRFLNYFFYRENVWDHAIEGAYLGKQNDLLKYCYEKRKNIFKNE